MDESRKMFDERMNLEREGAMLCSQQRDDEVERQERLLFCWYSDGYCC
jgi:hypothetical protein